MKQIIVSIGLVMGVLLGGVFATMPVMAATTTNVCDDDGIPQELKDAAGCPEKSTKTVDVVIQNIIPFVMGMLSFVGIGVIIYGGFTFLTSAGDGGKVQRGRKILISGVAGLIVAWGAYAIVAFALSIIKK